jgi:hypothetical protein
MFEGRLGCGCLVGRTRLMIVSYIHPILPAILPASLLYLPLEDERRLTVIRSINPTRLMNRLSIILIHHARIYHALCRVVAILPRARGVEIRFFSGGQLDRELAAVITLALRSGEVGRYACDARTQTLTSLVAHAIKDFRHGGFLIGQLESGWEVEAEVCAAGCFLVGGKGQGDVFVWADAGDDGDFFCGGVVCKFGACGAHVEDYFCCYEAVAVFQGVEDAGPGVGRGDGYEGCGVWYWFVLRGVSL